MGLTSTTLLEPFAQRRKGADYADYNDRSWHKPAAAAPHTRNPSGVHGSPGQARR